MAKLTEHSFDSEKDVLNRISMKITDKLRRDFPEVAPSGFQAEEPTVVTMKGKNFSDSSITKTVTSVTPQGGASKLLVGILIGTLTACIAIAWYFY